jgi:hypothetical protein
MSGGGGGSGNDGSNDMEVSGMEAAMSTEKGISNYSDTRTSSSSYNDRSNTGSGSRPNPHTDSGTSRADLTLGPDRSTIGMASDAGENFSVPQSPPGISQAFDYETEAYKGDANIDAGYGPGKITSAVYDAKTGKTKITQTVGIIDTATYQTANLQAYLDSPDVSDKAKVQTLNQLQALSNSNLQGSKLNKVKGAQTTKDFVVENLDIALRNLKSQTKNSKYTSLIDETATTKAKDFADAPLDTVIKSGGIIGSVFSSLTDHYRNNKALKTLGYTGKVIKEQSSRGDDLLTGVQSQDDRDAMNQLAPSAPFIASGTKAPDSVAAKFFGNSASKFKFDFQSEYSKALANQKALLNKNSGVGLLAVNQSPFYDFLKKNNIDKGIL